MAKYLASKFNHGGLSRAAQAVRSAGRYGDRHIVHVNDRELDEMRSAWGEPTINPKTGMPEFFDLGGLISDIAGGVGDALGVAGQLAGPIMSLFGLGAPAAPAGSAALIPGYTPPIGKNGPQSTMVMAPQSMQPAASSGMSGLLSFLNPKSNPVGMGALTTLLDALFPAKAPSVAQQFSDVQKAATKGGAWNNPLPTYTYNNPSTLPSNAALQNYGETGGIDFYPGSDTPVLKARGGMGRFMHGPDGGQDDTVPANLSDGEYVLTAQDVSDLGDGNSIAGARKLDKFRDELAKAKGRKHKITKPAPGIGSLIRKVS